MDLISSWDVEANITTYLSALGLSMNTDPEEKMEIYY